MHEDSGHESEHKVADICQWIYKGVDVLDDILTIIINF